jgi:hypothetical protein
MKTRELIDAIVQDDIRPPPPARALSIALIPAVAIALGLFLVVLGFRPNLLACVGEPRFLFKFLIMDLLAAMSGLVVLRLVRPGARARDALLLLAIPGAFFAAGLFAELVAVPSGQWHARMMGANSMFCLKSIPLLGFAPLVAALFALRNGAPDNAALAGAAAGLFAGAIGGAIYALHCPDDSPLFVAVWYVLAIAFVTAAGAALGARLLRW